MKWSLKSLCFSAFVKITFCNVCERSEHEGDGQSTLASLFLLYSQLLSTWSQELVYLSHAFHGLP